MNYTFKDRGQVWEGVLGLSIGCYVGCGGEPPGLILNKILIEQDFSCKIRR